MLFTILKTLSIVAVFQSVLFGAHLYLQKKHNSKIFILLTRLFILFIIFLSGTLLNIYSQIELFVGIGHLASLSVFLAFPLCFLFLTNPNDSQLLSKNKLAHALPFVIVFIVMFERMIIRGNVYFVFTKHGTTLISLLLVQNIAYLVILLKRLSLKKTIEQNLLVHINTKDLKIIKYIVIAYLIILVCKIAALITWFYNYDHSICLTFTSVFFSLSFILVNTIVLLKLTFPNFLNDTKKYQTTGLKETHTEEYIAKLEEAMEIDKIYLDPLLTMEKLAKKLVISKNHISQIINENFGVKYNDYINKYRINEAQRLIKQNKFNSLLEVAYEVGFNSKSTFNTSFKKVTGLTPSQYRNTALGE